MRNVKTIMQRELLAFYTSPVGYIFMIVFLAISVGLYITTFFTFPMADMRSYFGNLPIMLCVFIPAVTMRVWAEERKENTWEMLLTFPMKPWELALGKFLGVFTFFAVTLACTFTVPAMLVTLGNPDNGAIVGGYLGTLLMGAYFLSIGIFFSGFCKDQIVAFVVTLMACFAIFLLGTNLIAGYIDGVIPEGSALAGLGSTLANVVGVIDHYSAFTRGVFEVGDVVYFVAWTALFLFLNILYIDGRSRPRARATFGTAIGFCLVIGLAFNWLMAGTSLGRFDMTEDKIYTVSEASKTILSRLEDKVQLKLYITPRGKMPTELASLEADITDKLEELRVASGGRIELASIYMEASNVLAAQNDPFAPQEEKPEEKPTEEKAIEERMLDKGITPFPVQAIAEDAMTTRMIYAHIGIGYRDKPEEIIAQVVPQMLPQLEYRVVSAIYKLTREKAPIIAMVAPTEQVAISPEQRRMLEQFGQEVPASQDPYRYLEQMMQQEKYDVRRVELTQESPLPEEYDALVIVNPRSLNDRQRWEINRVLVSGRPVFLAVQNHTYDYNATRQGLSVSQRPEEPMVNDLLDPIGVRIDDGVLMDANSLQLQIASGNALADMMGMGQPIDLATHMLLGNTSMNQDVSITSRLSNVFYLWGSALAVDQDKIDTNQLKLTVLMHTSDKAKNAADAKGIQRALKDGNERYPVMAMLEGQFPDAYAGKERPAWPEPQEPPMPGQPPRPPIDEGPAEPATPAPGKLILSGGAMMFRDDFLGMRGASHIDLFLNCVDAIGLTDELVHVRSQQPVERFIDKPSDGARSFWKFVNYVLVNAIIAGVGLGLAVARRRARDAYTMSFATGNRD